MKFRPFLFLPLLCACAGGCLFRCDLPEATVERGGVTFDFEAISAARFKDALAGNVLKEPVAGELKGPWSRTFELPHASGGVWRVSCRYRLKHLQPGRDCFKVWPGGPDCVILETGGAWKTLSVCAQVPPGEKKITVAFTFKAGAVEGAFRDLAVRDETPKGTFALMGSTTDRLDGTYAVAEGQASTIEMNWRRLAHAWIDPDEFVGRVELPAGVAYVGANWADTNTVKTVAQPDGSSVTTFRVHSGCCLTENWATWQPLATVVKGVRAPGPCGRGRIAVVRTPKNGPAEEHALGDLAFSVVPAIHAAKPKEYANGVMPGGLFNRMDKAAREAVSRFMADCGVGWMVESGSAETYAFWRGAGIGRITPSAWQFNDGYVVGEADKIPPEDAFIGWDEKNGVTQVTARAVCPVTVYEGSDFFRTRTTPYVEKYVKHADGAWSNWEPWPFRGNGCYCDRCCRKFAAYAKRPYEEVKAKWPGCVRPGGEWHAIEPRFRSLEHAKVVKTLDGVVRAATGGDKSLGFIPAIAWIEMSSWWRPRNYPPDVQAIDYAGALRWINPWGPYCAWESAFPYVYAKRKPLCQFFAAKDVRATVDADYPAGARPKLMGLPQGHQCQHWLSQPEHISMALDSYFFNGWESCVEYFFPHGYDARYWAAFAEATDRAAQYERFVKNGRRVDADVRATPFAGCYARPVGFLSGYLPEVKEGAASPLQTVAWRQGASTVVAVFNFWQKGEAFFNLKVAGLKGKVLIKDEKRVLRAKSAWRTLWDAAEIAEKGVDLVVPAARCRVFEFRSPGPGNGAAPTSILTDEALGRLHEERRADLEKAAAADAEYEDGCGPVGTDWMPVI